MISPWLCRTKRFQIFSMRASSWSLIRPWKIIRIRTIFIIDWIQGSIFTRKKRAEIFFLLRTFMLGMWHLSEIFISNRSSPCVFGELLHAPARRSTCARFKATRGHHPNFEQIKKNQTLVILNFNLSLSVYGLSCRSWTMRACEVVRNGGRKQIFKESVWISFVPA